jgi:hypothetical protein
MSARGRQRTVRFRVTRAKKQTSWVAVQNVYIDGELSGTNDLLFINLQTAGSRTHGKLEGWTRCAGRWLGLMQSALRSARRHPHLRLPTSADPPIPGLGAHGLGCE